MVCLCTLGCVLWSVGVNVLISGRIRLNYWHSWPLGLWSIHNFDNDSVGKCFFFGNPHPTSLLTCLLKLLNLTLWDDNSILTNYICLLELEEDFSRPPSFLSILDTMFLKCLKNLSLSFGSSILTSYVCLLVLGEKYSRAPYFFSIVSFWVWRVLLGNTRYCLDSHHCCRRF